MPSIRRVGALIVFPVTVPFVRSERRIAGGAR